MIHRRSLLCGLAMPAIVAVSNLMPIRGVPLRGEPLALSGQGPVYDWKEILEVFQNWKPDTEMVWLLKQRLVISKQVYFFHIEPAVNRGLYT